MKTLTIDIETTGVPQKNHTYDKDYLQYPYILSIAWKVNDEETRQFIINQEGRKISPEITRINGITDEMTAESTHTLISVLAQMGLEGARPDCVIGHGIYFDTSIIKANILRLIDEGKTDRDFYEAIEELLHKERRVDTMMKTIKFCNLKGKWPKLTELYDKCFPGETFEAHNSQNDVDATYKCFGRLKELGVIL